MPAFGRTLLLISIYYITKYKNTSHSLFIFYCCNAFLFFEKNFKQALLIKTIIKLRELSTGFQHIF